MTKIAIKSVATDPEFRFFKNQI